VHAQLDVIDRLARQQRWTIQIAMSIRSSSELRISNNPLPEGTIERLKEALPNCTIY